MQETLNKISTLYNERQYLYNNASKLTPAQRERMVSLSNQIYDLWETYRREYAGERYERARKSKSHAA